MNSGFVWYFLVYLLGFGSGAFAVCLYAVIKLRSIDKRAKDLLNKIKSTINNESKPKLSKSVKDRLTKAFDITEAQLNIMGALDQPQSGPLHGKYKNNLNSELKALEEEKVKVLKSILDDGYNPNLTILNASTGLKETISLEEYMKRYGESEDSTPPPPPSKPTLKLVKTTPSVKE